MPFVCPTINYFLANDELRLAKQVAAVCRNESGSLRSPPSPHRAPSPPRDPHGGWGQGDTGVPRAKAGLWNPPASRRPSHGHAVPQKGHPETRRHHKQEGRCRFKGAHGACRGKGAGRAGTAGRSPLWRCRRVGAALRQQMSAAPAESTLSASRCDRSPRALCAEELITG